MKNPALHEGQCPRPVYQSGMLWATRYEEHDWRLYERSEVAVSVGAAIGTEIHQIWYCTKCRTVETVVEA